MSLSDSFPPTPFYFASLHFEADSPPPTCLLIEAGFFVLQFFVLGLFVFFLFVLFVLDIGKTFH